MNYEMLARLLRYAMLSGEDSALLRKIHPLIEPHFADVAEDFYRRILADEATRRIFADLDQVLVLKHSFRRWLSEVFTAERDEAYTKSRLAIGDAHVRVGLPPAYVFAAMSHVRECLERLISSVPPLTKDELLSCRRTVGKVLDIELALISEAYHEADKYRDMFDLAPEMIHALDRSGRFILVNRTEERRLGYPKEQLLGMQLEDFVVEADRPLVRRHLERVLSRGESSCEVRLVTATGEIMDVEILAVGTRDTLTREIVSTRGYVRDVTPRRRAEHELRKERELEHRFLDVAEVMILMLERDGTIRLVNPKTCSTLGYKAEELAGKDWFQLAIPESHRERVKEVFDRLLAGHLDDTRTHENPVLTKTGEERLVEWRNTVLRDDHGRVEATISSGLDVTEARRITRELMEKKSLARLGEMAAVVAHEVKNPLAGISGAIQVLGDNLAAGSPDREVIREIVARIESLNAIVDDLLLYARPRLPRPIALRLRNLVDETLGLLKQDKTFDGVTIEMRGDDPTVQADPELLKPTILNLFINAAQAMGRGVITVDLAVTEGGGARIAIRDRGPGIPASIRERVFEPFFTTKHKGSGLGLSIAHRIVTAHGGRISIDCPKDGGTTVSIALPAVPPPANRRS